MGGDSQSQKDFLPIPIIKYQLDNSGDQNDWALKNGNQHKGEHEASFPLTWCMREKHYFPLSRGILG